MFNFSNRYSNQVVGVNRLKTYMNDINNNGGLKGHLQIILENVHAQQNWIAKVCQKKK